MLFIQSTERKASRIYSAALPQSYRDNVHVSNVLRLTDNLHCSK